MTGEDTDEDMINYDFTEGTCPTMGTGAFVGNMDGVRVLGRYCM